MPITAATLAANLNHAKKGERFELDCARDECDNTFIVVASQVSRRKYCSKRCLGLARVAQGYYPPRVDPAILSARMKQRYIDNPTCNPFYGRTPTNYIGYGKGGYVEELGFYVRSEWERKYLLGLLYARVPFIYEPERFDLGNMTYLPDILIDGTNFYIEIVGRKKFKRTIKMIKFRRLYDVRLHVVYEPPTPASIKSLVKICKGVMP